jgi:acetolactate synthase-1/2/3 large subunit
VPVLTGGEAVVQMLSLHGVDYAFGMGGFQTLPYYDAIARQDRLRHVVIRDEKHGAFAADAYARVANRPAVADATLGPGATNLVSGAAESLGASIPLILITGEVNQGIAGRAATQESDQFAMLAPTTKAQYRITQIQRVPELMRAGISAANSGRPGPILFDIPEDVFHGQFDFPEDDLYPSAVRAVGDLRVRADAAAITAAAAVLRHAQRPVILAGGGVHLSRAYDELRELAESLGAPVATTISGKGAIDERSPASIGLCGRYSRVANEFVGASDALLVVGCKLGEIATDRWTLIPPSTALVHVDIDPQELGKVYRTAVPVWGDAKLALADLVAELGPANPQRGASSFTEVSAAKTKWQETALPKYRSKESPLHMARVIREVQEAMPSGSILVADGGFAAHWSALLFDAAWVGRSYIANRGHAAIGYGLPGAIGAKLAAPDRTVFALCGDNGFAMAALELETAKRAGANVVVVVVNNQTLGYIKALQHGLYNRRYISVDFLDVDYAGLARSIGCYGQRVTEPAALAPALSEAIGAGVPAVLDVAITRDAGKMLPGIDRRMATAQSSTE